MNSQLNYSLISLGVFMAISLILQVFVPLAKSFWKFVKNLFKK